jgi:putative two-component system response regulator
MEKDGNKIMLVDDNPSNLRAGENVLSGKYEVYTVPSAAKLFELLLQSSQLHDVGKIAISDTILNKPGKLSPGEFEEMKKHAAFGVEVIEKIEASTREKDFLKYAKIFAGTHHEKWDGTGYPKGLKGRAIPLPGRIMAVADVYDALISERPYKRAFTHEAAVGIITEGRGTQFDPVLVDLFAGVEEQFRRKEELFRNFSFRTASA